MNGFATYDAGLTDDLETRGFFGAVCAGRYVYFSEDLTPGPSFEYNKDPNAGIYAIRRLDRTTGELDTILQGPGGAARPQPSPDGRRLAFVRRVRDETALFLYDTETGAETPLTGGLSRDQQETWAIFGVYPNFAWTPDGSALVLWANGGLHRVDAAFRRLVNHLQTRTDVQNIDMMNLAGFCRNCLSRWYQEAANERGIDMGKEEARELFYGMTMDAWKTNYQTDAQDAQKEAFKVAFEQNVGEKG